MRRSVIGILFLAATLTYANESEGYVGITVREDLSSVIAVLPDSPGARAGVLVGDRILAVDGRSTRGLTAADFARLVSGAVGSAIQIDVQRSGTDGAVRLRLDRLPRPTPAPSIPPDFNPHQASISEKDLTRRCS